MPHQLTPRRAAPRCATPHHPALPTLQVLLRWSIDSGFVPIFGTTHPAHLRSNYDALAWRLDPDELASLNALEAGEHVYWDPIHDAERRN